ncbi:SCO family protein [Virgibacillus ndiopensis]|uniref:SCO family protein n=1 Tax=Virgibacillus ndiopensis TaxID=2004408 RepID=UPI000C06DA81|nr:SCO family protein [Virgibacillus ndiopensis]
MIKNNQNTLAIIVVILFGSILFYVETDGFRAYTAESARTYELLQDKPKFPSVTLEDSQERTYTFKEFGNDKYVFLTFMYTSCKTVCPQLEMNMAQVYDLIPRKYMGEDIVFLSISFDPARDNPKILAKYRTYFGSDGETWRMARITDQAELDTLLKELGVIVIPDGNGNFTHNTAFYLIGKKGHLQEMMDFTKIKETASKVVSILENEAGD